MHPPRPNVGLDASTHSNHLTQTPSFDDRNVPLIMVPHLDRRGRECPWLRSIFLSPLFLQQM